MRKAVLPVLAAVLLGGVQGCGGTQHDGDVVKAYLRDVAEVTAAYKLIRNDSQTQVPMETKPEALKARIDRDVEAVKALKDLPEDRLLEVQVRYGPALERLTMAHKREIERLQTVYKKKGVPPAFIVGLEGVDTTFLGPDLAFLSDGYATLSKRVVQEVREAVTAYKNIQKAEQGEDAIPALRRLRYRLSVDAVRLQRVESSVTELRDAQRSQLKNALAPVILEVQQEQARVRALGGSAADAAAAFEPWPEPIAGLMS